MLDPLCLWGRLGVQHPLSWVGFVALSLLEVCTGAAELFVVAKVASKLFAKKLDGRNDRSGG